MANKRFLGLGFTFAATDKGLLKHLRGVQGSLAAISNSLDDIEGKSGGMKGLGESQVPGAKHKGIKPEGLSVAPEHRAAKMMGDTAKATGDSFISGIRKTLNDPSLIKVFDSEMKRFRVELDESGNLTDRFRKSVGRMAFEIAKADEEAKSFTPKLKKIFASISGYFSDVAHKADNFFQTLGVDLKGMIPPQLAALGSLFKTITAPLASFAKSILTGLSPESKSDKIMRKVSSQVGGPGTGKYTVVGLLAKLVSLNAKSKEGSPELSGFFGKLITGIGLLAGSIVAYPFRKFTILEKVVEWFNDLVVVKKVSNFFKELETVQAISGFLTKAINGVIDAFEYLKGLPIKVWEWFKEFEIVKTVGTWFSKTIEYLKEFKIVKDVIKIFDKLMEIPFAKFLLQKFGLLGKVIGDIAAGPVGWFLLAVDILQSSVRGFMKAFDEGGSLFEKIAKGILYSVDNFLGNLPSMLFNGISDAVKFLYSKITEFFSSLSVKDFSLGKMLPSVFGGDKPTDTPTPKAFPLAAAKADNSEKQVATLEDMLAEMKRGNDLSEGMLTALNTKNGGAATPNWSFMQSILPKGDNSFQFASEGQAT